MIGKIEEIIMSVNKVILVGNLGADPEVHQFSNGGMVANVSIATTERWTDKQTGERKEMTEWHRVVFNNRLAEIAQQYLRKGSQIYVEGSLRTRKWQDQNGQDRYSTEIRAMNMQMLGGNPPNVGQNMNQNMNQNMGGQPMGAMGGGYPQNTGYANNQMNQGQNNFAQGNPQANANPMNNSFANPSSAPQAPMQPQQPAQQAQPQQNAVMSDAPADDDIPF